VDNAESDNAGVNEGLFLYQEGCKQMS